jgi:serine/threonine protein kinase
MQEHELEKTFIERPSASLISSALAGNGGSSILLPNSRPHVGQTRFGSSLVVETIGEGGMATVYKVWNERLEVFRAVKLLSQDAYSARFETEAKIIAKLHHVGIVEVHNIGEWNGLPYMEMEYVDGSDLQKMLAERGKLPEIVCVAIAICVAEALTHAHIKTFTLVGKQYCGIIHRDLKPANIMISNLGAVKLTDFGIARPAEASLHTIEGNIAGTIHYLSPEQMDGGEVDNRSDIYSFGTILYEMITGVKTFPQGSITELMKQKSVNKFKSLNEFGIPISADLVKIISRCLKSAPAKRYQKTQDLVNDLQKLIESLTKLTSKDVLKNYFSGAEDFINLDLGKTKTSWILGKLKAGKQDRPKTEITAIIPKMADVPETMDIPVEEIAEIADKPETVKAEDEPKADKPETVKAEDEPKAEKQETVKAEDEPKAEKLETVKAEDKPKAKKLEAVKAEDKPKAEKSETMKVEDRPKVAETIVKRLGKSMTSTKAKLFVPLLLLCVSLLLYLTIKTITATTNKTKTTALISAGTAFDSTLTPQIKSDTGISLAGATTIIDTTSPTQKTGFNQRTTTINADTTSDLTVATIAKSIINDTAVSTLKTKSGTATAQQLSKSTPKTTAPAPIRPSTKSVATASGSKSEDEYLREAIAAINAKRWNQAIEILEQNEIYKTKNSQRTLYLLNAYVELRLFGKAQAIIDTASTLAMDAYFLLCAGKYWYYRGYHDKAIGFLESSLNRTSIVETGRVLPADALYFIADIKHERFKATPSALNRSSALEAWRKVRNALASKPDDSRAKRAAREIFELSTR